MEKVAGFLNQKTHPMWYHKHLTMTSCLFPYVNLQYLRTAHFVPIGLLVIKEIQGIKSSGIEIEIKDG